MHAAVLTPALQRSSHIDVRSRMWLGLYAYFTPPTRTRQDCLVASCRVLLMSSVWTELETSQQKISKLDMFSFCSFVLSRNVALDKTVESQIYRGLLKTSCSCRRYELGIRRRVLRTEDGSHTLNIRTQRLVARHSGRTWVFGRRTFPVLRSTCSWRLTTYVGKPSAIGQPTRPTKPFILSMSIN